LTGEHDLTTTDALRRILTTALAASAVTLVDLSQADLVDCAILGVLVEHRQHCTNAGGHLALLVQPSSLVRRILDLTHLDDAFTIVEPRRHGVPPDSNGPGADPINGRPAADEHGRVAGFG
jgi:anti-anti-sigma factor